MLYPERRRRRVVQQSLPSISVHNPVQTPQPSFVEQLPFPQSLGVPEPFYFRRSRQTDTLSLLSRPPDSLDTRWGGIGERQMPIAGQIETPVPPSSLMDVLGSVNTHLLPKEKAGQTFRPIPKSPTTSFYQPIIIPGQYEKVRTRPLCPPQPKKQRVMVHLSMLCLCLFVVLSVLMLISPISK